MCCECAVRAAGVRRDAAVSVDEALRGLKLDDVAGEVKAEYSSNSNGLT
jgi:hypothetical protein